MYKSCRKTRFPKQVFSLVCFRRATLNGGLTLRQVSDVADSLSCIHSRGVTHGDLKGVREVPEHPKHGLIGVSQAFS